MTLSAAMEAFFSKRAVVKSPTRREGPDGGEERTYSPDRFSIVPFATSSS